MGLSLRVPVVGLGVLLLGLLFSAGLGWLVSLLHPTAGIIVFALVESVCLWKTLRLMLYMLYVDGY